MKAAIDSVMMFVISLVIVLLAIGLVVALWYTASNGPCWGNTYTQIRAIQSVFSEMPDIPSTKSVYAQFDSCVEGVIFMNKEDFYQTFSHSDNFPAIKNSLGCLEDFDAFIVAAPRLDKDSSFFGGIKDFALYNDANQAGKWGIRFLKEETNKETKPICENLPIKKATFDRPSINEIPTLGDKYCIRIGRTEELKFTILAFEKVTSKEQCKDPET
ncbi:MAG: hypothetical protein HY512_03050 [Candidatus Aenigmarchaeota archaeon]|nr:hypothetical protein [Candidatus Aenigmarchaeota archaeon]